MSVEIGQDAGLKSPETTIRCPAIDEDIREYSVPSRRPWIKRESDGRPYCQKRAGEDASPAFTVHVRRFALNSAP